MLPPVCCGEAASAESHTLDRWGGRPVLPPVCCGEAASAESLTLDRWGGRPVLPPVCCGEAASAESYTLDRWGGRQLAERSPLLRSSGLRRATSSGGRLPTADSTVAPLLLTAPTLSLRRHSRAPLPVSNPTVADSVQMCMERKIVA